MKEKTKDKNSIHRFAITTASLELQAQQFMKQQTQTVSSRSSIMNCSNKATISADADYVQVENDDLVIVGDHNNENDVDVVDDEDDIEDEDDFILVPSETTLASADHNKHEKKKRNEARPEGKKVATDTDGEPPSSQPSLIVSSPVILQKRKKKKKSAIASSSLASNRMSDILSSSKLTNNKSLSPAILIALLIVTASTFWWFFSLSTKDSQHHQHPLESGVDIKATNDQGKFFKKNGTLVQSKGVSSYDTKNDISTKARREVILTENLKFDPVIVDSSVSLSSHVLRTARRRRRRRSRVSMSYQQDSLLEPTPNINRNVRRRDDSVVLKEAGLVTILTFKNFGDFFVGETKKTNSRILMVFYQPSDRFDQDIAPILNEIAIQGSETQLEKVGVVNCKQYRKICKDHFIDKFPTIRWYRQNRSVDDMKFYYDEVPVQTLKNQIRSDDKVIGKQYPSIEDETRVDNSKDQIANDRPSPKIGRGDATAEYRQLDFE